MYVCAPLNIFDPNRTHRRFFGVIRAFPRKRTDGPHICRVGEKGCPGVLFAGIRADKLGLLYMQ